MFESQLRAACLLLFTSVAVTVPAVLSAQSTGPLESEGAQEVAAMPPLGLPDGSSPELVDGALDDPANPLYVIQPNDALEIYVYGESELSRRVVVRPDGRISLPLVQDLQAAGLNPQQLKQRIEQYLSRYLSNPNVTVIIDAIQSYEIYLLGAVVNAGILTNEAPITVLHALAMAGGFQQFADKGDIVIIRQTGNQFTRFPFDYDKVIKGEKIEQNILLESGDLILVHD